MRVFKKICRYRKPHKLSTNYLLVGFVKMQEWWIASGPPEYWKIAFEVGRIWGVTEKMITRWKRLSAGDYVLFYATKPISGVIGYGVVRTKFRQDKPLWPQEIREGRVLWPYRFEFDVEYCLPPEKWETDKVSSEYIAYAAIGGFQRIKKEEAKKIIEKLVPSKGSRQKLVGRCHFTSKLRLCS